MKKTYKVTYERDEDGWWVGTCPSLRGCHTQGRSIAQTRERLREAMALFDVSPTAVLAEEIHVGKKIEHDLELLRSTRERAEQLAKESAEQTRRIADRLAKAGLSRRDVGELLGISFQRVQQLTK